MSDTPDTSAISAFELLSKGGRAGGVRASGGADCGEGAAQGPFETGPQHLGGLGTSAPPQDERGDVTCSSEPTASEQTGTAAPAPSRTPNHNQWTQTKMAAFLRALAASQSVAGAARSVGMSRQSAYRLKNRLAATPFALGWEVALEAGFAQLAHAMMDRAINGVEVPHYYQGELVGTSRAYDERLAIWIANNPWKVGRQQVAREFSAEGFDRLIERIEYGPLDWGADCAAHDGLGDGGSAGAGGEAGEPGDYSGGYIDTPPGLEDVPATHDEAQAQQRAFLNTRSWYAAQVEEARGLRRK